MSKNVVEKVERYRSGQIMARTYTFRSRRALEALLVRIQERLAGEHPLISRDGLPAGGRLWDIAVQNGQRSLVTRRWVIKPRITVWYPL